MIEVFIILGVLSIIVQTVVDRIKLIVPIKKVGKFELPQIYSLAIGIVLGIVCQIDFLAALSITAPAIVGQILTGFAISGGSAFFHELIAKLRNSRNDI